VIKKSASCLANKFSQKKWLREKLRKGKLPKRERLSRRRKLQRKEKKEDKLSFKY